MFVFLFGFFRWWFFTLTVVAGGLSFWSCSPIQINSAALGGSVSLVPENHSVEGKVFASMFKKAGCRDFEAHAWDFIYKLASLKDNIPLYYNMKEKIRKRVQNLMKGHPASRENINSFAMRFTEIYALVVEFINQNKEENVLSTLIHMEYGDEGITENYEEFHTKLQAALTRLNEEARLLNQNCKEQKKTLLHESPGDLRWGIPWFQVMKNNLHPLTYGAKKVMSTAYQSCQVLDLPLMSNKYQTQGVRVTGRYRRGYRRAIFNKNSLNQSHYYLSRIDIPNHPQCVDVHSSPVIYNYGGKPKTTRNSIDLFQNKTSSNTLLGVDCSGFVTTALASAGLRLRKSVPIRPGHIYAVSSWLLKKPKIKNFSCLKKQVLSKNNPLRSGDIIASNSHVIIVDETGRDPFGLQHLNQAEKCHSRSIKSSQFNFSIIQSSTNNNAVGINRMHISQALPGMRSIRRGLQKVASKICYNRFQMQTHANIEEISILRHDSENPQCREKEIYLKHQECLKFCEPSSI